MLTSMALKSFQFRDVRRSFQTSDWVRSVIDLSGSSQAPLNSYEVFRLVTASESGLEHQPQAIPVMIIKLLLSFLSSSHALARQKTINVLITIDRITFDFLS